MCPIRSRASRSPGRPRAAGLQQRNSLLQAARELIASGDGRQLALRQVALRAGVTPALASYYFANRDGMLVALLDEHLAPAIDTLVRDVQRQAARPVAALTCLVQKLTALAASDGFLCRALLLPTARPLRERLRAALRELLLDAQARGQLRADLPPEYLAESLLGLCLFPFLDAGAIDRKPAEHAAALTLQIVALLKNGIVRAQRPRHDAGS
jgi:AcrR family transcriptional regulator